MLNRLKLVPTLLVLAVPATAPQTAMAADAAKGRALFAKKSCVACHATDGKRKTLGPDLSKLEKKLTKEALLEALKEPDKKIRKGYETWVVLTDEGKVLSGRLLEKTDKSVRLIISDKSRVRTVEVAQDSIDVMKQSATSLMPRGLLKDVSDAQVEDLLAYLGSLPDDKPFDVSQTTRIAHSHGGGASSRRVSFKPMVDDRGHFAEVDAEFVLTTVPRQMRYDKSTLRVKPGSKVRLTLRNADEMNHNLVVCRPGKLTWFDVAKAAWALGPDGPKREFIPDSDLIVAATRAVPRGRQHTIDFQVPDEEGAYPFVCTLPGHAFLMRGEILVSNTQNGLTDLQYAYYEGSWQKLPDFAELDPKKEGPIDNNIMNLDSRDRANQFGFVFNGTLNIAVDGEYTFFLSSDDGSRVEIDGKTAVEWDGVHPDGEQRTGKVQLKKGAHQFRTLFFEQGGGEVLRVAWKGPGLPLTALTKNTPLSRFQGSQQFQLVVNDVARMARVNMPDASSRAIAVGLPGGVSYCFDAQTCEVRYGWTGGFLDVGPDRGNGRGRGGGVCRPLGERFNVGANGFPLSLLSGGTRVVPRFKGYRRTPDGPTFFYEFSGHIVEQTVMPLPEGTGLHYMFRFREPPDHRVAFFLKPDGLKLSSSAGKWDNGMLTVPAKQSQSFSVTVEVAE